MKQFSEEQPLLGTPIPTHTHTYSRRILAVVAAAFLVLSIPVLLLSISKQTFTDTPTYEEMTIKVFNKYNQARSTQESYDSYPWLEGELIVEPHSPSLLAVSDSPSDSTHTNTHTDTQTDTHTYTWDIDGSIYTGPEVQYMCKSVKKMDVQVKEEKDGVTTREWQGSFYCKYVRREIRTLTDEDREAFFDAVKVLYNVNQEDGQQLFGNAYVSMEELVLMHNQLAGDKVCDHAHDGLGFLTSHVAITNIFERSLQAVDPAVSVPYWDFTIEQSEVNKYGGNMSHWFDSVVFSDDWFGPIYTDTQTHVIDKGRFAYSPIKSNLQGSSYTHNGHGLLRAPWNMNKYAYVTRCPTMMGIQAQTGPSCTDHYIVLQVSSWEQFAQRVSFSPHGPVHLLIGGTWGADYTELFRNINYDTGNIYTVATNAFSLQKNMWREGYYVCPTECGDETDADLCKCTCPDIASWKDNDEMLDKILGLIFEFSEEGMTTDMHGNDVRYQILRILCNDFPGVNTYLGDQLESASPADVSFWPIHPTLERLWQWKRLSIGFEDESWDYDPGACSGHNPDDFQPFLNIFEGQDGLYTNRELVEILHPSNDELPYIYDNFIWDHCVPEGFDRQLRMVLPVHG